MGSLVLLICHYVCQNVISCPAAPVPLYVLCWSKWDLLSSSSCALVRVVWENSSAF